MCRANLVVIAIAAVALVAGGCANSNNQPKKLTRVSPASGGSSSYDSSATALDIAPTPPSNSPPVLGAYQPAPQPVVYDTAPAAPVATAAAAPAATDLTPTAVATAGGTHKVKKGDTLFSIAKARYGDGKQWRRIAAANPGLSPSTLKAGATISIP
ncbi:MAG TPA: LysM domain-containing protein [Tepidisphaeraceae bacterium]|nr:LysM domain-containing protein [Tepidisphaeraceae bacterium]